METCRQRYSDGNCSCHLYKNCYLIQFTEADFQPRTRATYESHVADLNGALRSHIATTYGITNKSILNTSRYFHVVDGLVPDIMHDMLEGTLQLTLKCLLCYLIKDQSMFSLTTLNERIASFHYGQANVQNRPSEISRSSFNSTADTLRQSGIIIIVSQ